MTNKIKIGAVQTLQQCEYLRDLEYNSATCIFLVKIGFDIAENDPPKLSMKWDIDPHTSGGQPAPRKYRSAKKLPCS